MLPELTPQVEQERIARVDIWQMRLIRPRVRKSRIMQVRAEDENLSSAITKSGSTISGDSVHVKIVKTNPC